MFTHTHTIVYTRDNVLVMEYVYQTDRSEVNTCIYTHICTYKHNLTRDNVLVMEYVHGVKLVEAVRKQGRSEAQRRNITFEQLQVQFVMDLCIWMCMYVYA